jgi:hypothetical protein
MEKAGKLEQFNHVFIPSQTLRNRESSATSPNTRSHNKAEIHIDAYTDTGFEFVSDIGHELRNENCDKIMAIALGIKEEAYHTLT